MKVPKKLSREVEENEFGKVMASCKYLEEKLQD